MDKEKEANAILINRMEKLLENLANEIQSVINIDN